MASRNDNNTGPPVSASLSTGPARSGADSARESVNAGLRDLVGALEQQWLAVTSSGFESSACDTMARLAHTLVGRAASFDLPEVAELATFVNTVIVSLHDEQPGLTQQEQDNVAIALKRIRAQLRGRHINVAPASVRATTTAPKGFRRHRIPRVYLVDDDDQQVQHLAVQLTAHGFSVEAFKDWSALRERLTSRRPDAIVADIGFPEGHLAGMEAVDALLESPAGDLPVVFLSVHSDTSTRLEALQAGGRSYFTKPVWLPGLAAKLHELTGDTRRSYRVLLVDDDQDVLELHQTLLLAQGFEVHALQEPHELVEVALRFRPEVVVLDLYMPGVNGMDLARMLRQDEAFFQIPVVFLSAERDPQIHHQAIAEGGMDFLNKPVVPEEIAAVLASRAGFYRRMRAREDYLERTDPVTGLYNRSYLTEQLEQQLAAPRGGRRGLGILYLELDNFLPVMRCTSAEELNRLRERVARVIKSHLLGEDLAACYSDHVFVVLTWRADADELQTMARALCSDIASDRGEHDRPIKLTASIGIYRAEDSDYKQALASAALACAYAHQDGGNRVYLHEDIQLQQALVDQKRHWLQQIKNALNNQRFFLMYQPISDFSSEESHRYEVFLRMLDDHDEVILPNQFLGIVRQLGLLRTLDRWVITHALRYLSVQQQIRPRTLFFIKLSDISLGDARFPEWLDLTLSRSKVAADSCVFQVTEKVAHAQQTALSTLVGVLRKRHCALAVENIGDSELWQQLIGRVPIQYLKLARAVIQRLDKNEQQQDRFKEILGAAREQGIKVIASYVENANCLAFLYQHQVDLIQGYFLQPPDRSIDGDAEVGPA